MQSVLETAELCLFPAKKNKIIGELKCDSGQCFDCSREFWSYERFANCAAQAVHN